MNHDQAWQRLPDLLDDRDDSALLAHVGECPACQRQLFLLGRIDRILRRDTPEISRSWRWRRGSRSLAAGAAITAAAAAAGVLVLRLARPSQAEWPTRSAPRGWRSYTPPATELFSGRVCSSVS